MELMQNVDWRKTERGPSVFAPCSPPFPRPPGRGRGSSLAKRASRGLPGQTARRPDGQTARHRHSTSTYVVHGGHPPHAGVEEPAGPVAPAPARDGGGERVPDDGDDRKVPPVLPLHHRAPLQVADVRPPRLHPRPHQHPPDVRVQQPPLRVVRVQRRVRVPVVRPVAPRPPVRRALHRARPRQREYVLQPHARVVRPVRPQAVVPCAACGPPPTCVRQRSGTFAGPPAGAPAGPPPPARMTSGSPAVIPVAAAQRDRPAGAERSGVPSIEIT